MVDIDSNVVDVGQMSRLYSNTLLTCVTGHHRHFSINSLLWCSCDWQEALMQMLSDNVVQQCGIHKTTDIYSTYIYDSIEIMVFSEGQVNALCHCSFTITLLSFSLLISFLALPQCWMFIILQVVNGIQRVILIYSPLLSFSLIYSVSLWTNKHCCAVMLSIADWKHCDHHCLSHPDLLSFISISQSHVIEESTVLSVSVCARSGRQVFGDEISVVALSYEISRSRGGRWENRKPVNASAMESLSDWTYARAHFTTHDSTKPLTLKCVCRICVCAHVFCYLFATYSM